MSGSLDLDQRLKRSHDEGRIWNGMSPVSFVTHAFKQSRTGHCGRCEKKIWTKNRFYETMGLLLSDVRNSWGRKEEWRITKRHLHLSRIRAS
jgi:hypothetical protein